MTLEHDLKADTVESNGFSRSSTIVFGARGGQSDATPQPMLMSALVEAMLTPGVILEENSAPTTPDANEIFLFAKDVAGVTRPFFRDSAGVDHHLTYGTSALLLADGNETAPALAFASDTNTGLYRLADDTIAFSIAGSGELKLGSGALSPVSNDGLALGVAGTNEFSDAFFATGAVLGFGSGDLTLTHSSNTLTLVGGELVLSTTPLGMASGGTGQATGFLQSGTGATARTWQNKLRDRAVDPEDFGATADGTTDDATAIQAALTAGKLVWLGNGKSYAFGTRLNVTVAGTGIIGDGTATLIMLSGAGKFDNSSALAANRYGTNAVGILASSIARPICYGFRIKYETQTDDRYVKAIAFKSCSDITIEKVEAWNFTKALGVIYVGACSGGSISRNRVHSCTTNSATTGQISGIELDNDDTASADIVIAENHIHDLTVGASFLTSFGYQTDGINVVKPSSSRLTITNNIIETVGEGIDHFGGQSIISDNLIYGAYIYGIKLVHGASRNVISGNLIQRAGLAGIVLAGTSVETSDTDRNLVVGNHIQHVDPDAVWSASSTACISITANGGVAFLPRNNHISENFLDGNGTGKYGILAPASSGVGNTIGYNRIANMTVANYSVDAGVATLFANMAAATVKGRAVGAGTGDPTDLTAAQLVTIINTADGAGSGLDADLLDGANTGTSGAAIPLLNGNNTHSGSNTFSGTNSFTGTFVLQTTNDNADWDPTIITRRESASPAVNDLLTRFLFQGRDSGANLASYAYFGGMIVDPTDGSEDGAVAFFALVNGADTEIARFGPRPYMVNAASSAVAGTVAHMNAGSSPANELFKFTSSGRYKRDIEALEDKHADVVMQLRPVWYRSAIKTDRQDWSTYGLIAEEVAELDPRLVAYGYADEDYEGKAGERKLKDGAKQVPMTVNYHMLSVMLLNIVKRQDGRIAALEKTQGGKYGS